MSGPTAEQTQLQQEQIDAYQQAADLTAKQYENQQSIFGPLVSQFKSIYAKGPNQKGFSDTETQDLNSRVVEGTAENYAAAAKALGEKQATEGGGNNPLPSGAQSELQQELAASAAGQKSKQESEIAQADYSQGYDEWENAGKGLETIAAGENPLGFESAQTESGSAASKTASDIASEDNSWINAAIGAVGTAGGMAASAAIGKH
jgi:hypothetical protein